jgi:hypothetical protein
MVAAPLHNSNGMLSLAVLTPLAVLMSAKTHAKKVN